MKIKFLLYCFSSILLWSCNTENEPVGSSSTVNNTVPTTYQPLNTGNQWVYKTEITAIQPASSTTISGIDVLKVISNNVINGVAYKKMSTLVAPTGFYCRTLNNNDLRVDGSSLKLTGSIGLNLGPAPLNFNVTDFVILKENGTSGEVLSETAPVTITDNTSLPGYPLQITYKLKSTSEGSLSTFTSNGVLYTDVKKSKVVVNVRVTTESVTPIGTISIEVLAPQDVITSYQYYKKDLGVVYADTKVKYHLATALGTIPQDFEQQVKDIFDTKNF